METTTPQKKTILSGMQPTNDLTFGQYAGALKNWVELQHEYDSLFCVVDLHAITVRQEPAKLRKRSLDVAAMYMAAGIDPNVSTLFIQSHVPEHAQLAWVLNCLAGFGEVSRMTQFKDKSAQHADNVNVGLFTYPVLMAADILLYNADLVPVGEDQRQHLELTRNLAERFNFHYSPTFTVPEPFIPKVGAKIMSLQEPEKKMSKSDANDKATVFLIDSDDVIMSKIKRAVTDSGTDIVHDAEKRPGVANLMTIHHITTGKSIAEIQADFAGLGYAEFKEAVGEALVAFIRPVRERYTALRSDEESLKATLKAGAEHARDRARKVLRKVYKKTGFVEL
ncbi:MAG: tryptophan--tRNA ligase [Ignavibacteria bacterium]|nr:tryptophan--tRNA ligase [Ignavibacteria bacterium]MBK9182630.1 tryptophan--tRNA ligase [Ignavibacteria bacterium]